MDAVAPGTRAGPNDLPTNGTAASDKDINKVKK